ncbi:hypothetical protein [Aeromicrobium sp.]|uniref:hypothetical protein n=1 Tax=Aeromicrobium sp. TaxID=1871063 RepID=UPI0019B6DB23|nr:hypothetical protein [Aeromicrobium sp.]MBC7631842.1 hypothetical protein [Aeromicrobium sp.]
MERMRRPQAIGAFPLPAGFLLIATSDDPAVDSARDALVAGRVPSAWPSALRGHELAHAGRTDEAVAEFAGTDVVDRFNRFVLAPEGVDADELRADLPPEIAPLVDVVRYSVGLTDDPPVVGGADQEIEAIVLATRASGLLGEGSVAEAVDLLRSAAEVAGLSSAPLSAIILGNAGVLTHEHELDQERAIADLTRAVTMLEGTDLAVGRAELHYHLASMLHQIAAAKGMPLSEAVVHYHLILRLVTEHTAPHLWASTHLNLATAYLTAPMIEASDQLRSGIAVQSLRSALEVFTREDYPAEWSSATINLANALIYTPSAHQGDNVVEAIEKYEEVLELRDRHDDPIGRARLLTNQGNALAHLGIFDHAKSKLVEARFLFEEQLDHDSVMMVRSVLDEIAKAMVPERDDAADRVTT